MTGRWLAQATDDLLALQDIAQAAGVSIAEARRVLAAAGKLDGMQAVRLMGTREQQQVSAPASGRAG